MTSNVYLVKFLHDGVTKEHKTYASSMAEARLIIHAMFANAKIYFVELYSKTTAVVHSQDPKGEIKVESSTMELELICKRIDDLEQAVSIFENLGGAVDLGKVNFVQFFDDEDDAAGKAKMYCRKLVDIVCEKKEAGFIYLTFRQRDL